MCSSDLAAAAGEGAAAAGEGAAAAGEGAAAAGEGAGAGAAAGGAVNVNTSALTNPIVAAATSTTGTEITTAAEQTSVPETISPYAADNASTNSQSPFNL